MIDAFWGVNVVDEAGYAEYRRQMMPILDAYGGGFVLDVRVSEVIKPSSSKPFNRLFCIRFPSTERLDAFFTDARYLAVRSEHFASSVDAVSELGRFTGRD